MSSNSQPSFRFNVKNKLKKVINPVREQVISSETFQYIQEKAQNLTDSFQNRSIIDKFKNKTRGIISEFRSPSDNQTLSEGFYDSLFTPDTANDVYFEVIVICLWAIALLCIIPTMMVSLIPSRNFGVKTILFHVFLCEFLYLIYVLLSMINVAQNFQLNTIFCFIANYGIYVTIPVMYFAILFLSLERVAKRFNPDATWTKIFTNGCLIQLILLVLWAIAIGIMVGILLFKFKFSWEAIAGRVSKVAPAVVSDVFNKIIPSSYQCSVDGRLSSIFKVLFIVLFVVLIVLIVKSLVITIFYSSLVPSCSRKKKDERRSGDRDISVIYLAILFFNLFFSAPFYVISMANSVYTLIKPKEEPFPMILKISFLFRLISIILQCFTFHIIEKSAWKILSKLLNCVTRGKFPMPSDVGIQSKPSSNNHQRDGVGSQTAKSPKTRTVTRSSANNASVDFSKNTIAKKRSGKTTQTAVVSTSEASSDEEVEVPESPVQERNRLIEETPLKTTTPKSTNPNGVSKNLPNGKSVTKSTPIGVQNKNTAYDSIPSSSSDDAATNDESEKPAVIVQPDQPGNRQLYRTKRVRSTHPIRRRSRGRHYVKTVAKRTKSPRNVTISAESSKPDRLSKMIEQSHEV